ncbi:hypothetical protein L1049_002073 [Liquidambar formosana]|uniref:C3H1-type domain-containing protein n=1 Tax=Liquidambar formosana TaxID=63359 RepID=A0AAP0R741_LIQFO
MELLITPISKESLRVKGSSTHLNHTLKIASTIFRTGTCKFGLHCRFNHPVRGVGQVGKEREKERNGFSEKTAQIECKYYLTEGGCKFGEACRYNHSTKKTEIAPPEYNFLGLPIRLGQKDCPFYMRNGSCGYGAKCWFHHPDPTAVGGSSPYGSTPNW